MIDILGRTSVCFEGIEASWKLWFLNTKCPSSIQTTSVFFPNTPWRGQCSPPGESPGSHRWYMVEPQFQVTWHACKVRHLLRGHLALPIGKPDNLVMGGTRLYLHMNGEWMDGWVNKGRWASMEARYQFKVTKSKAIYWNHFYKMLNRFLIEEVLIK